MKTFRIHLKDGKTFAVKAHHFTRDAVDNFVFFKSEEEVDEDIYVSASEVVAIVADEPHPAPTGFQL